MVPLSLTVPVIIVHPVNLILFYFVSVLSSMDLSVNFAQNFIGCSQMCEL